MLQHLAPISERWVMGGIHTSAEQGEQKDESDGQPSP
jgi:hypothetical protein